MRRRSLIAFLILPCPCRRLWRIPGRLSRSRPLCLSDLVLATDIIPRMVFEQLQTQLGQPIVVENRGWAAGGTIGALQVVKSDPDAYTWLVSIRRRIPVAPALYPNLQFNAENDLVPMSMIGSVPNVLIISPEKGIKTIQDFVAFGKANPGKLNFASLGVGSAVHMSAGAFPCRRRLRRGAYPVQGRRRSLERGYRRPRRLLFLPDRDRVAAYPGRQVAGAGRQLEDARRAIAECADHARSRLPGSRLHASGSAFLVRSARRSLRSRN